MPPALAGRFFYHYNVYSQSRISYSYGNEWTTATYNSVDRSFEYWGKKQITKNVDNKTPLYKAQAKLKVFNKTSFKRKDKIFKNSA